MSEAHATTTGLLEIVDAATKTYEAIGLVRTLFMAIPAAGCADSRDADALAFQANQIERLLNEIAEIVDGYRPVEAAS